MSGAARFHPSRFGIVGLYEYADQEFGVEDGRLALRGRNTSGKSKALELLVPFVLDGDITPRKLDPFASSAKTMRWNLIECTDPYEARRANKRIGYVWAEFVRQGAPGEDDEYLTCGIGLEATRSTDGVRGRWYFTTRQRVGADLHLTRATTNGDMEPIVRGELGEQLHAGGGALHEGPAAYKEALRAQLLPFATSQLYEQTLDVIRLLRKPKLSDSLNVNGLSAMLSKALPAVDEGLVRRLGDALEQLHELQRQFDELRQAREEVASIVTREYRSYARGVVALRAERLRQSDGGYERARATARAAADELDAACAARDARDATRVQVDRDHTRVDGEYLALVQSEAFKVIAVLDDRAREQAAALQRVQRASAALDRADGQVQRSRDGLVAAASRLQAASAAAAALGASLTELLRRVGLAPVQIARPALAALPGRLAVRGQDVERAGQLAAVVADAALRRRAIVEPLTRAATRRDDAATTAAEIAAQLELSVEAHLQALRSWQRALRELPVSDEDLDAVADATVDESRDAVAVVTRLAQPRGLQLALERARVAAARERAAADVLQAREQVAAIEAQRDPQPDARPTRPPDRSGRAGAPLWAACDFHPDLSARERAELEAALEDAGLLDAWISADGQIHDADLTLTVAGEPDAASAGRTLAELLVPDPAARGVPAAVVAGVLGSLPLEGLVSVAPGRFRFGPLHGRSAKAQPEFIGATARAARRERLLAGARADLAAADERLGTIDARAGQLDAAAQRLADECADLPPTDALRSAQRSQRRAAERLDLAEAELRRVLADRDAAERVHGEAVRVLEEHTAATGLPTAPVDIRAAADALGRTEIVLERLVRCIDDVDAATATLDGLRADALQLDEARDAAFADCERARAELDEADGRLRAAEAADGASAQELQTRAAALRTQRDALGAARRQAENAQMSALEAFKDAQRCAERAQDAVRIAEAERVGALECVRVLGRHDLLSAAFGRAAAPDDERASSEWTLTTALERVRALPDLDLQADLGRRATRVGEAVSRLQRKLSAFDMNAATYSEDDITLVEITREGRRTTPTAMLAQLDGDLEHREQILSARRREVLGRALLGEIAEHLRTRITAVRASVRARNETLRGCPTGAGRTVSLSWDPDEDAGAPAGVLGLLGDRATEHLNDADRDTLFAFLHQRIADARAGAADEAAQTAIVDHLAVALDYRRWWRFTLHLHERDGSSRKLTARTQGLGSGGEQSVLMHLPLFATAAQLYDLAPGSPRIIALDEAMDGIDAPTREQMFALLVALDLDWVMTSYDINPCVATVPRVGFYELHRDNAEWGVWAQHFVWDGDQITELVDG